LERCRHALTVAPDPLSRVVALQWVGLAYEATGHHREARSPLEDALTEYRRFQFVELEAWTLALLSEAALGNSKSGEAQEFAMHALELATRSGFQYVTGLAERSLGRVARANGSLDDAQHHLDKAVAIFQAIEARWELARTFLEAAAVAHGLGEEGGAVRHLSDAHRLFTEIGVSRYVERTTDLALELGLEVSNAP
jgi:tetratricopeptide (TPR) repeat protein